MYDQMCIPEPQLQSQVPVCEPESPELDAGLDGVADAMGNSFMVEQLNSGDLDEDAGVADLACRALGIGDEEDTLACELEPVIEQDPDVCSEVDEPEVCVQELPEETQVEVADAANTCMEGEGPTPQDNIAAAETARAALEPQLTALQHLPPDRAALVQARLDGLEGEALVKEMEVVSHALASPNPERALSTYAELHKMIEEDPERAKRLDSDVIAMMVNGTADARTSSDRGKEGIMGVKSARDAANGLLNMSDEQYAQTRALLEKAGTDADGKPVAGADPGAEQALILKTVAARRDHLDGHWYDGVIHFFGGSTEQDDAMSEVETFANDIRGMKRDELILNTTLQDIDDVNTSTADSDNINGTNDTQVNNDGLYQRFHDSCAPTSSQILRGEADPAYALKVRRDDVREGDAHSETADEQRRLMNDHGGVPVSRLGEQAVTPYNSTATTLEAAGTITSDQRTAMDRMMQGQSLSDDEKAQADTALAEVRKANGGHPTEAEVQAMKDNVGLQGRGVWFDEALNDETSDATHQDYKYKWYGGGTSVAGDLDDIDRRLLDGEDVPFQIDWSTNGAHAMSITDVRYNPDGSRMYLVCDPWKGDTNWVKDTDFAAGKVPLGSGRISGIVTGKDK